MAKSLKTYQQLLSVIKRDVLYHGTLDIYVDSIKKGISLAHSLDTKDFGKGFYLTTNYGLAKKTAERQSRRHNRRKNKDESKPTVLEFIIREEYIEEECSILYFDKQDEEWFGFISSNKNPERQISEIFPNKWTGNYSIIYGPLADGVLGYMKSVAIFEENTGLKSDFLNIISEGYEFPQFDQLVIKDEALANKILTIIN